MGIVSTAARIAIESALRRSGSICVLLVPSPNPRPGASEPIAVHAQARRVLRHRSLRVDEQAAAGSARLTLMRILVIGAGGVGSAFVPTALRRDFFERLVISDYDADRAEAIARRSKDRRVEAAFVDASNRELIASLIREQRITHVLNAVDPRFVMPIFDACLEAGADYLDMAMSL